MHELSTRDNEHREWNREHVHWLEDLTRWRAEREEALELFRTIEYALRFPEPAWDRHQEAMVALEQELARHQHHLEHGHDSVVEQARHDGSRKSQAEQRALHIQLKAQHEAIMQHLRSLQRLLARKS